MHGNDKSENAEPDREKRVKRDGDAVRQGAWFGISDNDGTFAEGPFAGVVFNRPIEQVLTYRVPGKFQQLIRPGQRVRVPLGRGDRLAVGYCVRVDAAAPADLDPARIKDVVEVLDPLPLIDDKMLALTRWMADYYACSWGQALDAVVPAGVKKHAGTRIGTFLAVAAGDPSKLAGGDPQAPAAPQADRSS